MKDIGRFINLGFTIVSIILICLYIGYKTNNYVLCIIVGVGMALFYLLSFLVKKI